LPAAAGRVKNAASTLTYIACLIFASAGHHAAAA
jgi:hypothetical protein